MNELGIWLVGTLFFIVRYALIAGLFYGVFYVWREKKFLATKIQQKVPTRGQINSEILYSLSTLVIYGLGIWLFLFWIQNGKTKLYGNIGDYGVLYFLCSIVIMIVLHDTYFYWTHRLIHHRSIFKYVHLTHHRFSNPTPWAAFAFHPFEAIISLGIIPIILFLIPYHQWALIIFITFLTVYNAIIHLGYPIPYLTLSTYQNTGNDHNLHHRGVGANYGLYFNIWDKLMGTYRKFDEDW
ncbi:sterol desaturase family protein [Flagellimonas myxillae]|uniref:sterol desaturase family protein n=1 Tax=Flagellimonas myxillae TaxID=2942214 RepID=UPI00201ECEE7|nr:sterol desaturase family protein [Muricauda myxillae]MCL6266925.1 sterol desaturase family protein [Muricauda myxillae]